MHPNGHSVLSIILFLFIVTQSADGAGGQVGGTGHSHLSSHLVGQTLSDLMWEYLYIGLQPSLGSGHWGRGAHRLSHLVSHLTAHTFVPIFSYTRDARQLGEPELEQWGFGGHSAKYVSKLWKKMYAYFVIKTISNYVSLIYMKISFDFKKARWLWPF